jgi:hypothetical protein
MGENHEHDADDDYGACFHKVFIFLGAFFVKSAPRSNPAKLQCAAIPADERIP